MILIGPAFGAYKYTYCYRVRKKMPAIRTNSNSITAILIEKLNNQKSGFRSKIIKDWNLPENIYFVDGTHSTINIDGMNNKEVDIIGYQKNNVLILIEVKANKYESLQDSQKKNGEYEKVVKKSKNKLILKYIIPKDYAHIKDIPILAGIVEWNEIYNIAKEYDNTGFSQNIEYFVEHNFNNIDYMINKGDISMYFNASLIGMTISLFEKLTNLMSEYILKNNNIQMGKQDYLGYEYTITNNRRTIKTWIGLYNFENSNNCYFIWLYTNKSQLKDLDLENNKDFIIINNSNEDIEIAFPIVDSDNRIPSFLLSETYDCQKEEYFKLITSNIDKVFSYIK